MIHAPLFPPGSLVRGDFSLSRPSADRRLGAQPLPAPPEVSRLRLLSAACGGGGSDTNVELYFVDDTYAYTDPTERGVYVSAMCSELAASAVKVSVFEESAMQDGTVSFVRGEV